ncbi:lysostaphin resistance A-like protein [Methanocella sp. MCL-LM]|uniref:CPBP family intramembrane glutamic endopeptidase n=1 Tax=Methanocella sp. MCL-LM TaxID=3412035 RepID=UPI003C75BC95
MAGLAERFPNLYMLLKVVLLLVVVLLALVGMSLLLLAAIAGYVALTGGDLATAAETALSALMNNVIVSASYMVVQNIALVLIAVFFMAVVEGRHPVLKALGLGRDDKPLRGFAIGGALNVFFLVAVLLIILLTGVSAYYGTGLEAYGTSQVGISLIAMAIGTLFVGLGEEAVFRGYLQQILADKYGVAAGLIVTSVIFALFHSLTPFAELGPLYIVGVFALSMLLGYLFVITKSLYASIGFHCIQDFLALQIFSFTGERTLGAAPIFMFTKPDEIYLSGMFLGSWDDLISIIMAAAIILGLYLYRRSRLMKKEV